MLRLSFAKQVREEVKDAVEEIDEYATEAGMRLAAPFAEVVSGGGLQLGVAGFGGGEGLVVLHKGLLRVGQGIVGGAGFVDLRFALVGVFHFADGVDFGDHFGGGHRREGGTHAPRRV